MIYYSKPFIIESAFNSSNFTNITSDLLASIRGCTNHFYWINDKLADYDRRTKDLLYNRPYLTSRYYTKEGLKEEFRWYYEDLKAISKLLGTLQKEINLGACLLVKDSSNSWKSNSNF